MKSMVPIPGQNSETGASLIEYCLLVALIALFAVSSANALGYHLNDKFAAIESSMCDGGTEQGDGLMNNSCSQGGIAEEE